MNESEQPESSSPTEEEQRGESSELTGRLAAAVGVMALVFAVWLIALPSASEWVWRSSRILPRLSIFALSAMVALILQGCKIRRGVLAVGTLTAGVCLVLLQSNANLFEIIKVQTDAINARALAGRDWAGVGRGFYFHARPDMLQAGAAVLLIRFECAILAAVFLGTWIGRGVWSAWHFVALTLFAAVCDFWLNWFHVADHAQAPGILAMLRLPFVPALGGLERGPAFTDIVFASAIFEAARAFRVHTFSLVLGALAGYCSGCFLGLEPAPGWTHMSMTLLACGVLAAAWPDLKFDQSATGKLFLMVALLIMTLSGCIALERKLNPAPPLRKIEAPERQRNVARLELAKSLHLSLAGDVPILL